MPEDTKSSTNKIPALSAIYATFSRPFIDRFSDLPFIGFFVNTGATLLLFLLLEYFFISTLRWSPIDYAQSHLWLQLAEKIGPLGVAASILVFAALARFGSFLSPWTNLSLGSELRWFVFILAAVVAWPIVTLGFNYQFQQEYLLDKLLILLLLPGIYYRPVFVYPFLALVFANLWQLGVPELNNGSHFPHKLQVLHVLDVFAAAFLLHAVTGQKRTDTVFFLSICVVAAAYWQPALVKLQLNWINHGDLHNMPLSAYSHGWLSSFSASNIVAFSQFLALFDWPMRITVMILEVGCLFILFRRGATVLILTGLSVFHLGVFVLYGYLFWTWIAVNILIVRLIWKDRRAGRIAIFTPAHFVLAAILVSSGRYWCDPPSLGWYDTRLTYTFHYQGVGYSGKEYVVPPRFFTPYDDVFSMANFSYLVEENNSLVFSYGITGDIHVAAGLRQASSARDVFALEELIGRSSFNANKKQRFIEFLRRYLEHRNRGDRDGIWTKLLRAPPQFWTSRHGNVYTGQEPLKNIEVVAMTTLYDGNALTDIRKVLVADIEIPGFSPRRNQDAK